MSDLSLPVQYVGSVFFRLGVRVQFSGSRFGTAFVFEWRVPLVHLVFKFRLGVRFSFGVLCAVYRFFCLDLWFGSSVPVQYWG